MMKIKKIAVSNGSMRKNQQGLTLVELMVALTISIVISLAAMASLFIARQGFTTVDSSAQIRDNARFATAIMQRIINQSGFLDGDYAMQAGPSDFKIAGTTVNPEPTIRGFDNAKFTQALMLDGNGGTSASYNNSDMLAVRYQAGGFDIAGGGTDNTMIGCSGIPSSTLPLTKDDRMVSVFHLQQDTATNEPSLMCSYLNGSGVYVTQPLVQGVESMQILYGVDGVTPNTASTAEKIVPTRYLKAAELTVPANNVATNLNWSRVRTVKIAMVVRGPPGSSSNRNVPAQPLFGPMISPLTSLDPQLTFPAKTDGRLRQVINFTVKIRNDTDVL